MSPTETVTTDHSKAKLDKAHSHNAGSIIPAKSRAERPLSFDVATFPMPTGREEDWRFTPLKSLGAALGDAPVNETMTWTIEDVPDGVSVKQIEKADAQARSVRAPADRAGAIAATHALRHILAVVAPDTRVHRPVDVGIVGKGETVRGHLLLEVGRFSEATFVVRYTGHGELSEFVSIDVAEGASLNLVVLKEWEVGGNPPAGHRGAPRGELAVQGVPRGARRSRVAHEHRRRDGGRGRGGRTSTACTSPTRISTSRTASSSTTSPRAADRASRTRARCPAKPRERCGSATCSSGPRPRARTPTNSTGTCCSPDGARADSVPNLEIETGEIEGAGHASATGRFDDEQMFYLRSRGIPEDEARKMVVRGFFADLVHEIGVPNVEQGLMRSIDRELGAVHE